MLGDNIDFEIVIAVNDSWNKIKKIPNYAEVAGEILFRKYVERFGSRGDVYWCALIHTVLLSCC
jgi:hypothetical protein